MSVLRLGLFGGTFDPLHHGHLILAQRAFEHCRLDAMRILPAGYPPHRPLTPLFSPEQRLAFLRESFRGIAGFAIDDRELRREGPSYTYLTVEEIRAEQPNAQLFFCLGADSVLSLPSWREAATLAAHLEFIAFPRQGFNASATPPGFRVHWLPDDPIGISSTLVRERLKQGLSLRGYVPEAVREGILALGPEKERG